MAIHIHVEGERTPRPVGFDTEEVARYAAGLLGLDPGGYVLVKDATAVRAGPVPLPREWSRRASR